MQIIVCCFRYWQRNSSELVDKLFEDGVEHPDSQGLGMGLSIVKRLCESLNLDYKVNSSALGSEFRLTFKQKNFERY